MTASTAATSAAALRSWIDPRHLGPDAIAAAAAKFRNDPHQVLVLDRFLHEDLAIAVWEFLDAGARYTRQHAVYPGEVVSEEEWAAAEPAARFSRDEAMTGVLPERRMDLSVLAFLRLRSSLQSPEFVSLLAAISGLALEGPAGDRPATVKRMRQGDFIDAHDDLVEGRRLALNLHLSRNWLPDMGGELQLRPAGGQPTSVATAWNRAVLMPARPDMTHAVTAVTTAAGSCSRLTIGSWYR